MALVLDEERDRNPVGKLTAEQAKTLAGRAGLVLLALWLISLATVLVMGYGGRLVLDGLSALTFTNPSGATLDGELSFEPDPSLELREGAVFQLMHVNANLDGTFSKVTLPDLPAGLAWDTTALYSQGTVSIAQEQ